MFEHETDWSKAVALICDIAKGSASVSLRSYSNNTDAGIVRSHIGGWDYRQIQAHGRDDNVVPRLFTLEHLRSALSGLSMIRDVFYAYEVDGAQNYDRETTVLLGEFQDIVVTTITLTVGDVNVSWFLVSLNPGSDTIHWKMRYHDRQRRPGDGPGEIA